MEKMESYKLVRILLNENHRNILNSIRNHFNKPKCVSAVSQDTKLMYSHTSKILNTFEEVGLINKKKCTRSVFINLTKKGIIVLDHLNEVHRLINKPKSEKEETNG